jgi:hypothetical protein
MIFQTGHKTWKRTCSCGREVIHTNKYSALRADTLINGITICKSCFQKGEKNHMFGNPCPWNKLPKSKETLQKMSDGQQGRILTEETRKKLSAKLMGNKRTLGYKHSDVTREKLRNKNISEITREKLRKHRWNQIALNGIKMANYNPKACDYIDNLNKCLGLNLQHALNGGELKVSWYSLDGYDTTKNIVFEYDERYHESPRYKTKDKLREDRIINAIKPILFLRYNEYKNELYDVITNQPIQII